MAAFLEYVGGKSSALSVAMKRLCCIAATKIANEPTKSSRERRQRTLLVWLNLR